MNYWFVFNFCYLRIIIDEKCEGGDNMDVPKWKYGPFIQSARLQKQLTIEKLAEKVGCTGRFLQAVEQGTKCPGAGLLLRLCDVLSISADALIRPETTRKDFIYRTLVLRLASCDESALMRMYLFQSIMEANPNLLESIMNLAEFAPNPADMPQDIDSKAE